MEEQTILEGIIQIFNKQISDIDKLGESGVLPDAVEDLKRAHLLVTKKNYISFFRNIVGFLKEKVAKEKSDDMRFYLIHLRSLTEIYAHILYLSFQMEDRQFTLVAAKTLFTLSYPINRPNAKNIEGMEKTYLDTFKNYEPALIRLGIPLPENYKKLSKGFLNNNNLNYPGVEQMLKPDWIKDGSPEFIKLFPNILNDPYIVYAHMSNYVHSNPLFNEYHGKEKYWLISEVQIISGLISELIDNKIINHANQGAIKEWQQKLASARTDLIKEWKSSPTST